MSDEVVCYPARPILMVTTDEDPRYRLMSVWHVEARGISFGIDPGFRTDGASIPRFLWRVCGHPFTVPRLYAATAHDWLYTHGAAMGISRKLADQVYYDLLVYYGISRIVAKIEYVALRWFGGSHYSRSIAAAVLALFCACGCASRTRDVDAAGMYCAGDRVIIGSASIVATPEGEASASIRYSEDTAWLAPGVKTRETRILLTGTNAVTAAPAIVAEICRAFVATHAAATNTPPKGGE